MERLSQSLTRIRKVWSQSPRGVVSASGGRWPRAYENCRGSTGAPQLSHLPPLAAHRKKKNKRPLDSVVSKNTSRMQKVFLLSILLAISDCAVLRVPGDFRTLSSAVARTENGDVIEVSPGVYRGEENCNIVLESKNVSIVGTGAPGLTVFDCEWKSRCLTIVGGHSTISGITFSYGKAPATTTTLGASRKSTPSSYSEGESKVFSLKLFFDFSFVEKDLFLCGDYFSAAAAWAPSTSSKWVDQANHPCHRCGCLHRGGERHFGVEELALLLPNKGPKK